MDLSDGSGTMKNEFGDPENPPRSGPQTFFGDVKFISNKFYRQIRAILFKLNPYKIIGLL